MSSTPPAEQGPPTLGLRILIGSLTATGALLLSMSLAVILVYAYDQFTQASGTITGVLAIAACFTAVIGAGMIIQAEIYRVYLRIEINTRRTNEILYQLLNK